MALRGLLWTRAGAGTAGVGAGPISEQVGGWGQGTSLLQEDLGE